MLCSIFTLTCAVWRQMHWLPFIFFFFNKRNHLPLPAVSDIFTHSYIRSKCPSSLNLRIFHHPSQKNTLLKNLKYLPLWIKTHPQSQGNIPGTHWTWSTISVTIRNCLMLWTMLHNSSKTIITIITLSSVCGFSLYCDFVSDKLTVKHKQTLHPPPGSRDSQVASSAVFLYSNIHIWLLYTSSITMKKKLSLLALISLFLRIKMAWILNIMNIQ